tara:strand:- start:53 stop:214 length:162 start_codon:yes stop_codon:yes gene_type:complete
LRKKFSSPKNKLKKKEKGQKPRTILKNGLFERNEDEECLLREARYLQKGPCPK